MGQTERARDRSNFAPATSGWKVNLFGDICPQPWATALLSRDCAWEYGSMAGVPRHPDGCILESGSTLAMLDTVDEIRTILGGLKGTRDQDAFYSTRKS